MLFDQAVTEEEKSRITFNEAVETNFKPTVELRDFISKVQISTIQGITIKIFKEEPILKLDPDTDEKKPEIKDGVPVTEKSLLGIVKVDLEHLFKLKAKKLTGKYRLFPSSAEQ